MNLVIGVVGDSSLHHTWLRSKSNFDLALVYYGDNDQIALKYKKQAKLFFQEKGTKFNIVNELVDRFQIDQYDYIFIPDDDLHMPTEVINRVFELAQEHKLDLCQPSIVGYYDVGFILNVPESLIRFTNFVHVICPCFSKDAFKKCLSSFTRSKSCWGIDLLWDDLLGSSKDKIAIIDDVVAVHTRKCFGGDNYTNNELGNPYQDFHEILEERKGKGDNCWKQEHSRIYKNIRYDDLEECYFPKTFLTKSICESLRSQRRFL